MIQLDETHDPSLRSWVESANTAETDFPIQNLPFGRFRTGGGAWRIGVAIGDQVLDLREAASRGGWNGDIRSLLEPLSTGDLNGFMALGSRARRKLRSALSQALDISSGDFLAPCLLPQHALEFGVPCRIGDYTDFYVGIHHATAVGKLFRPDNPLLPNYKWMPIGYHGRASSIVASETPIRRPRGQIATPSGPIVGSTQRLDLELELGFFVGQGNALGHAIPIQEAEEHLFGVALLNDWSARDLQAWEYQPLGPFLSKNFATSLSPWIVTMEALAPFRAPFARDAADPQPLEYLQHSGNRMQGAISVDLEVRLQTAAMREVGRAPVTISRSNSAQAAYWTAAQLIAHHTVNGCNLQPGDLLGSGTLSGAASEQAGSLLELTVGGKDPMHLSNGESRTFLQDGDTLILAGRCERAGARSIGFGLCVGTVVPS